DRFVRAAFLPRRPPTAGQYKRACRPNRDKNVTPTQPAQPLLFSRPIRFSPQLKTAGRPARTDRARIVAHDAPYDPWPLAAVFSKVQLERGPEGFARGYLPLHNPRAKPAKSRHAMTAKGQGRQWRAITEPYPPPLSR